MSTTHWLDAAVLAGGTLKITCAWYDDDGSAVTPDTMTYTLREADTRAIVNSRDGVSISSLSTSNDIVLSGDDLTEGNKKLFLDGTYTSGAGAGLPFRAVVAFLVRPFE